MNNDYYCGLNNHGNTCFFNSALQNILRCSVFINIISNLNIAPSSIGRGFGFFELRTLLGSSYAALGVINHVFSWLIPLSPYLPISPSFLLMALSSKTLMNFS